MTTATAAKWQNVSAGPRQVKDLQRAMGKLRGEGQAHDELTGVVGGQEHRSTYIAMMSPVRAEVTALQDEIMARYDGLITRDNVRAIIADYEAALPEARKSRPLEDSRRTPEADAELQAIRAGQRAAEQAREDAANAVFNQVKAKAPAGAKALIVAELHEDDSDIQTDYFNSRTMRTVAIGFRMSAREDFRALHAAAATFAETAGVTFDERRENYSMGGGNYLSDHGSSRSGSGWVIKSRDLGYRYMSLTEDAIAATPAAAVPVAAPGGVTVSPSSLGKPGVVEIRFSQRPADDVLAALKARGFRWARANRCWYGTDAAYAESLAGTSHVPAPAGAEPPAAIPAPVPAGKSTRVAGDVLDVLARCRIDERGLTLPDQLDRADYVKVDKILQAVGAKWNRSARMHLFTSDDAAETFDQLLATGEITAPKDLEYFPTPPAVVARLIEAAELGLPAGLEVLEPSAGQGAIAGAVHELGCHVDCVEIDERNARVLDAGCYRQVIRADFLAYGPRDNPAGATFYDRVIMNPPFSRRADVRHVLHAEKFMRPGGLLVSVMSAGVAFRQDKLTADFRDMVTSRGGSITPLPEDAFRESGTLVRTVLVILPAR